MVAGFAIDTRALARGIGADHPSNRSPVAGREFRRKKDAVRFDMRIELIEHHPRFNPRPALVVIHL